MPRPRVGDPIVVRVDGALRAWLDAGAAAAGIPLAEHVRGILNMVREAELGPEIPAEGYVRQRRPQAPSEPREPSGTVEASGSVCLHPRAARRAHAWGSTCGECGSRVT